MVLVQSVNTLAPTVTVAIAEMCEDGAGVVKLTEQLFLSPDLGSLKQEQPHHGQGPFLTEQVA